MSSISRSVLLLLLLTISALAAESPQRWMRFDDHGTVRYGQVVGDEVLVIEGEPWETAPRVLGRRPLQELRPLAPTTPQVVLGAAYNYRSHLGQRTAPTEPQFFWKSTQSLIANGEAIELPPGAKNAHFEAELVIVIGRSVSHATLAEAKEAIFGYTCGNDVSERTWQETDVQWWRAKGSRTFGPVGPVIVVGLDWAELRVRGVLNGRVMQDEVAGDMLFSPAEMVQHASQFVNLNPGDLIFTGSPGNTTALKAGDSFEVEIKQIGVLKNRVTASSSVTH